MSLSRNVALAEEDMRSVHQLYPWQVQAEHQRWRRVQTVRQVNLAPFLALQDVQLPLDRALSARKCALAVRWVSRVTSGASDKRYLVENQVLHGSHCMQNCCGMQSNACAIQMHDQHVM